MLARFKLSLWVAKEPMKRPRPMTVPTVGK